MSRSEERIPKLRTRGRQNRRKLLAEAERLLLSGNGAPLKFSDVFEAAGVSRGSAYRIYIGIEDLLQDMGNEWVSNFVVHLQTSAPQVPPRDWPQLSDFLVRRGAQYWTETADTMRLLPRIRSHTPSSYSGAVEAMADCLAQIFARYFVMPEVPDWHSKMAFFAQLCDVSFAAGVREGGQISEQRIIEAETLCRTYLGLYVPSAVPPRNGRLAWPDTAT